MAWALTSAVACTGGPLDTELASEHLLAELRVDPATVGVQCDGVLLAGEKLALRYSGISAKNYRCISADSSPRDVYVDEIDGSTFGAPELADLEASAFHGVHSSVTRSLREAASRAKADDWLDVHVWFYEADGESRVARGGPPTSASSRALRRQASALRSRIFRDPELRRSTQEAAAVGFDDLDKPMVAPMIPLRVRPNFVDRLGRLPGVWLITLEPSEGRDTSEAYYWVTRTSIPDNAWGYDGDGHIVAIYEPNYPDRFTNLDGLVAGNCADETGAMGKCHCPTGGRDGHQRVVGGMIRNKVTTQRGTADRASMIFANHGCGTAYGDSPPSSALYWAHEAGARVVTISHVYGGGDPQDGMDLLWDYFIHTHGINITASNGNNMARLSDSNLRNGLVVGGANDHGSTEISEVTLRDGPDEMGTSGQQYGGPTGLEVPHIVAPGEGLDTAGRLPGEVEGNGGGVSLATPQVAGAILSVLEANPGLVGWPEPVMTGIIAGAWHNCDAAQGGPWPLDLEDAFDDWDGAGLLDAASTVDLLRPNFHFNGGAPASYAGHDYGRMFASTTPASQPYSEVWNAYVSSGQYLRVASVLSAAPACSSPVRWETCGDGAYPHHCLEVREGSTLIAWSCSWENNYQYIGNRNTSGSAKTWKISIRPTAWSGMASTYWGVAWATG